MQGLKRVALFIPVIAWSLMVVGTANGTVALQGDDKSYGVLSGSKVEVCDMESDGHGVHTDSYDWYGNYFRADDQNGSTAGCDRTSTMGGPGVESHRTVEEVSGFDYKGDYSYH